jgi:hypothetical protein
MKMIHLVCSVIIHALLFKWMGLQQRHACFRLILFNKVIYMGRVFSPMVIILFFLLVGFSGGLSAQMYEDTWQSVKTYKSAPGAIVEVNNKYGSVIVSTWERDSVKIEVTRKIYEKSRERLNTLRDNIDVEYRVLSNTISVETVFGSRHSSLVRDIREMANLSVSDSRSSIDYKIYLPSNANIKIVNKYGNVVLPTMDGKVEIDLSNGDFQARDLNGDVHLTLAFGKALMRNLKKGVVSLNFVDFTAQDMETLSLEGRSSEIRINSVNTLDLNSRRDKIAVARVGSLVADTYFTNLNFSKVDQRVSLKMTYGELSKMGLSAGFQVCDIISQTSDVNVTLLNPLPYRAKVKQTRGGISLPVGLTKEDVTPQNKKDNEPFNFFFKRNDAANKLNINISDAELKIIHQ